MSRASSGKRISFEVHQLADGREIFVSRKIFSDGQKLVRLHIDDVNMTFAIVDAVTGAAYDSGGDVQNREVLFRKAKRHLKKLLDLNFEREKRNVKPKNG